jgi:hypothetical protein
VLRGPPAAALGAVVVGPDQLVEEALPPEERVQQHLRIVGFAIVEMHVERAVVGEQSPRLAQARLEELPVVVEAVVVAAQITAQARIARAPEAGLDLAAHAAAVRGLDRLALQTPVLNGGSR